MHRSAILSSNVAKLLEVMSKGAGKTSTLDTKLLKEALAVIGWGMEETVANRQLTAADQIEKLLKPWIQSVGAQVWGYTSTKEPKEFWFPSEEAGVQGMRSFPLRANPTVPPLAAGQVHVQKVEPKPLQQPHDTFRWRVWTQGWWVGVPALKFTDTKGGSVIVAMTVDDRGRISDPSLTPLPSFWTWAYKSGLQAAAVTALAGAEVAPRAPRPGDRSMDNTGICGVCMQNVKLAGGRIMRHGWSVQGQRGWGQYGNSWHTGPCMGFGYAPWEISPLAAEAYLKRLESDEPRMKDHLRRLQAEPDEIVNPYEYDRKHRPKILKGDKDYEPRLKHLIRAQEDQLRMNGIEIADVRKRLSTWAPKPLYGTMTAAARVASQWLRRHG